MSNIEDVLVDVRKAYRLLYVFNSKIIDLMKYIDSTFGMKFGGVRSLFTQDNSINWKKGIDNWARDFFNLYLSEFYFASGKTWLSVILQIDTGLWDKIEDIKDKEEFRFKKDKINLYNKPEDSKTRIIFITGNKYSEEKIQFLYDKNLSSNIKNEDVLDWKNKEKILYKIFDINKFIDEDSTLKTLKELISFLTSNGFDKIKIIKKGSSKN